MGYQTLDSVLSLQDDELKLLENIRHCVNLRIKCERDYASSLLVVSICAHKSDLSEDIRNTGACKAWVSIALEMEALSKSVSSNAEELCEVLELLDELINEKRAMRKSFIEEHNKCSDKLDFVLKLAQKTQLEYQKSLINYKSAKSKYEDIYMKLPKNFEDRNSTIDKLRKKYSESKKLYTKVCQKLHELHNDYCLITREAKQYENDFRTRLIPTLMEYHRNILISSGEKWKVILQKFVQKTDLSNEKYKSMQNRMNICVENVNGICGDIMTKFSSHSLLPQIKVNFNDKLLEDCTGSLKPNELVVDTFTVDSLRKKESELRAKLVATQNELRDKTKLLKHYEQEIQTLKAISSDNSNAKNGIHVRHRAIDIIKKEILYVETKHQRIHNLWEEVDKCLSKFAGIEVPSGLQLNADNNNSAKATMQVSHKSLASASSDTSQTYSPISWGRTLIRKLKRQKISSSASASVSTLATCHSSISRSSSVKQRLTLTDTDNELCDEEWFHGSLPRIESSKLLSKKGDFLVRRTMQKDKQCFVVSVLWNGFRHFIINIDSEGLYKFEGPSFTNISDLIEYYQYNKISITNKSGARLVTPIPRERWELNHDDIELKEKIGRGNFGDVYKGVLKKTGTGTLKEMPVAVKTCKINLPDEQKRKFLSEGRILKQHNHPNVVQLIGICVHKQPVMIVMELVDGGSLVNFLRCNTNRITLSLSSLMEMCIDAASGMEYLESKNCIHRDLAARNCLIGLPQRIVKISDFGMSREAPQLEYTVSDGMKQIPIKWTAPEALNYGRYTSLCDVWSFGILIWEIFTFGSTPYSGMSNAKARELIDNGYRLPCPPKTPDLVYKLMGKCWQYEPESRPHFSEITQTLRDIYKNIKRIDDCCREIEIAV